MNYLTCKSIGAALSLTNKLLTSQLALQMNFHAIRCDFRQTAQTSHGNNLNGEIGNHTNSDFRPRIARNTLTRHPRKISELHPQIAGINCMWEMNRRHKQFWWEVMANRLLPPAASLAASTSSGEGCQQLLVQSSEVQSAENLGTRVPRTDSTFPAAAAAQSRLLQELEFVHY